MTSTTENYLDMGFSTPVVSKLTGIPQSTLSHWVSVGLVTPEVRGPSGRRATRYWSKTDLVAVRAILQLRKKGCPLRIVKKVRTKLNEEGGDFHDRVLVWDGQDILLIASWSEVLSVIKHPGQRVLAPTVLSLEDMMVKATKEVSTKAKAIDGEGLRKADKLRLKQKRAEMKVVDFSELAGRRVH
jgi:DNA-binding transcriptional MerR regulator